MIKATFYYRANTPVGFEVTGHSETAESGKDIVCAGVTSAVMFAVNMITETFGTETLGTKATVTVGKNSVFVEKCEDPNGQKIIGALKDHLAVIQTDYPYALNIRIITETEE